MTDKAIQFAEFTFGDTFGNIRDHVKVYGIQFMRDKNSSRFLADAVSYIARVEGTDGIWAQAFSTEDADDRMVAGHRAKALLWFVYPSSEVMVENDALLYAGQYSFPEDDAQSVYDDLKGKLSQVYGEAYYTGDDLTPALGELQLSTDSARQVYMEEVAKYKPQYTVWKSSVNNAFIVLKCYLENGDWERTLLLYITPEYDEYFMNAPAVDHNNFDGL